MAYTKQFAEIGKADAEIAGGKGASLGEMTQAGIPVPPGFVLLASAFEVFLVETDIAVEIAAALDAVNTAEMHTVERASEKIQGLILQASMPQEIQAEILASFKNLGAKYVAVRSSATAEDSSSAAWAGQLDSFLNTTEESLLANIQKCWASLYTPRAIFYGFEKGFHSPSVIPDTSRPGETRSGIHAQANLDPGSKAGMTKPISVAVVVQAMVQSEISGIAFSVHPVTEDPNQLIIEAGYGLGEAVVSGQITPDSYVVTKSPLEILDKNISTQERMLVRSATGGNEWVAVHEYTNNSNPSNTVSVQSTDQKLTDVQILELSRLIVKIENHYGFPCDIEWAFVSDPEPGRVGQFYITQSRPITTLAGGSGIQSSRASKWEFRLSYSRDCSIILEQAWYKAQTEGFEELLGEKNPHGPVNIYYVDDGLLEIWENKSAVSWLTAKLRRLAEEDNSLVDGFISKYLKTYAELNKIWEKNSVDMDEFIRCCETFFIAVKEFARIFYLAVDEQAPSEARAKALDLRATDNLMDGMDSFIRRHLGHLAVHYAGMETLVLLGEVRDSYRDYDKNIIDRRLGWVVLPGTYYFVGSLGSFSELHPEFDFVFTGKENVNNKQHISGAIAYRGRTRGKVVIVNKKSEIEKVSLGDVLVSRMTIPDFIGAMKLASAFVTDEGGITSHAAIISREMQKPCIIGTKIATQVLHDGDLVEVDAERGVVTILQRADGTKT